MLDGLEQMTDRDKVKLLTETLQRLVNAMPRKDLRLNAVFALDEAKETLLRVRDHG